MIGCKRCGKCCQAAEIWLDPTMDEENAQFAMKRLGAHMMWREMNGKLKVLVRTCPHLSVDGRTCLIHEDKPDYCKTRPSHPSECVPGCRYFDEAYE